MSPRSVAFWCAGMTERVKSSVPVTRLAKRDKPQWPPWLFGEIEPEVLHLVVGGVIVEHREVLDVGIRRLLLVYLAAAVRDDVGLARLVLIRCVEGYPMGTPFVFDGVPFVPAIVLVQVPVKSPRHAHGLAREPPKAASWHSIIPALGQTAGNQSPSGVGHAPPSRRARPA